ncbi:MAG: MBOAT family protein [Clostridia bacterium]|nr:MBOAT family protein [Clostridia bacterium]
MSITALSFVVFIFALLAIYYLLPKKFQWVVLLVASICFYIYGGFTTIIYVLISAACVFAATHLLQNQANKTKAFIKEHKAELTREEKKAVKQKSKQRRRLILTLAILFNLAFLGVFKYSHFFIDQFNAVLSIFHLAPVDNTFSLIVPLGISYYTLMAIGYMADVYWGKAQAQKNFLKVLLFISFFPQITQGPISEYNQLSGELFKEHQFTYDNFSRGFQRMLWGFFKKMVIADALAPYVTWITTYYDKFTGITCIVGALFYMFQLYADFSGYMDIMCGYCEMLDIRLAENFNRPYFSKSLSELWRRWHITLGAWLRTYVYYPIAMSKWNQTLSQKCKKPLGEYASGKIAATIPLLFVWFVIGFWHDASWAYILWGFGNAFVIILSEWLSPVYGRMKTALKIRENALPYRAFQCIRTFGIFTFLEIVAAVQVLGGNGYQYVWRAFTNHTLPRTLEELFPSVEGLGGQFLLMLLLAFFGLGLMFVFSLVQRKKPVRDYFNKIPLFLRIVIMVVTVLIIVSSGVQASWGAGAFMYANF